MKIKEGVTTIEEVVRETFYGKERKKGGGGQAGNGLCDRFWGGPIA